MRNKIAMYIRNFFVIYFLSLSKAAIQASAKAVLCLRETSPSYPAVASLSS